MKLLEYDLEPQEFELLNAVYTNGSACSVVKALRFLRSVGFSWIDGDNISHESKHLIAAGLIERKRIDNKKSYQFVIPDKVKAWFDARAKG